MKKISWRFFLTVLVAVYTYTKLPAQDIDYSKWTDHLPYNQCIAVTQAGTRICAATPYSVFYFNKSDNSLTRLNKVSANGLNDIGISAIAYSESLSTLFVAYSNTNIDLVSPSGVKNIPDIKRKQIIGNKTINQVLIIGKLAYLSCGFGIVVVDLERQEIKDTYYIGPDGAQLNVHALVFHAPDNRFYAATERGIYSADAADNLAYYINWKQDTLIPGPNDNYNLVASFGGKIYCNKTRNTWDSDAMFVKDEAGWKAFVPENVSNRSSMRVCGDRLLVSNYLALDVFKTDGTLDVRYYTYNPGTIRPADAICDSDGKIWIADSEQGLWSIGSDFTGSNYNFNGPVSTLVSSMDLVGRQLWAVPGGRNQSFSPVYNIARFYTFQENKWLNYDAKSTPELAAYRDMLCVAADPADGSHAFIGSWGYGVLEMQNNALKQVYTPDNSSLRYIDGYGPGYLRVGGLAFDRNRNLWVTNSGAGNVLSVKKNDGQWRSFNLGQKGTAIDVGNIIIDHSGQKWMQLRDLALFVYNDNNTIDNPADDKFQKITSVAGNGNLKGSAISGMAIDLEGQLWLGTDEGVQVIYTPENVFTGNSYDAQQVLIGDNGFLYPLLQNELVTAIAVNGNNEKWLGTDKAGVFLMSADGTQELFHFTEANSPLLSNSIQSIKVADNGEVYFGTANGIVSYKDYKVPAQPTLDSLVVYPNPVRPGYNGPIYISNLVAESNIKITDASGGLVWQSESTGGQVLWNGNNMEGRRVNTGVYYIFITNADGSQKKAGKVLFVR